jgi:hypothetical protein
MVELRQISVFKGIVMDGGSQTVVFWHRPEDIHDCIGRAGREK